MPENEDYKKLREENRQLKEQIDYAKILMIMILFALAVCILI